MKRAIFDCILAWVTATTTCLPTTALTATIAVTTTADNGAGSLRQAIQDAASGDTVNFTVTGIITLTNGQLFVTNDVNITGPGATNLAISGNYRSRILEIASNSTVNVSGLTIRDGRGPTGNTNSPSGSNGGGIYNSGDLVLTACRVIGNYAGSGKPGFDGCNTIGCFSGWGEPGAPGGGIYNGGRLALVRCIVSGNSAGGGGDGGSGYVAGAGGLGGDGGGICNASTLTVLACTFDGNSGGSGGMGGYGYTRAAGGSGGYGGAIFNLGTLTVIASTFSGNAGGRQGAPGGFGPGGGGGAIYNDYGQITLIASTLSGNFSFSNSSFPGSAIGGGLYNSGSTVTLRSVIVSGNTSSGFSGAGCDLSGTFTSQGYNLIGNADGSSGFTNGINGDLTGTTAARLDAKLGAPQDNGGPTSTMALLPGSPALDHGDDALLAAPFDLAQDQRGLPRKSSMHVDIGAYELQAPNLIELRRSGNDIVITFITEIGGNYRLERSDVLGSDFWTTVGNNLTGTGRTVQFLDSGATNQPQYFYRAVMLP